MNWYHQIPVNVVISNPVQQLLLLLLLLLFAMLEKSESY
jgi:hypothetical protein